MSGRANYWSRSHDEQASARTDALTPKADAYKAAITRGENPCIVSFGAGPANKYCGGCAHLRRVHLAQTYLKCDQRTDLTHGRKTDQKASWPACARFEQAEGGGR